MVFIQKQTKTGISPSPPFPPLLTKARSLNWTHNLSGWLVQLAGLLCRSPISSSWGWNHRRPACPLSTYMRFGIWTSLCTCAASKHLAHETSSQPCSQQFNSAKSQRGRRLLTRSKKSSNLDQKRRAETGRNDQITRRGNTEPTPRLDGAVTSHSPPTTSLSAVSYVCE